MSISALIDADLSIAKNVPKKLFH